MWGSVKYTLKLVNVINFGRCYSLVIVIDSLLDESGLVVGFEAADNPLVFGLNMHSEIWFEILECFKDCLEQYGQRSYPEGEEFCSPFVAVLDPIAESSLGKGGLSSTPSRCFSNRTQVAPLFSY